MSDELSPDQLKVAETIAKLLDKAARTEHPAERDAFAAKAQELLAKHNLDSATVEGARGGTGRREQALVDGGFYSFHRDLWRAVAQLNFCHWWSQKYLTDEKVEQPNQVRNAGTRTYLGRRWVRAQRRRHALVGRAVNVRVTIGMAQYLLQAVERALRERLAGDPDVAQHNAASNWAWSFRKGCAMGIIEKLEDRREAQLAKERQAQRRAERAAHGASASTAVTLASYTKSEEEANADFVHGEGWSARQAARRAERAAEREEVLRAWTQWCEDNPEEARKQREKWNKRDDRNAAGRRGRFSSGPKDATDYGALYAGKDAAKAIGIDQQAGARAADRRIG